MNIPHIIKKVIICAKLKYIKVNGPYITINPTEMVMPAQPIIIAIIFQLKKNFLW